MPVKPKHEGPALYCVETAHLEQLKAVAKRLYTENRMNGDEMRDAAHTIMSAVRFAEALGALQSESELYFHMRDKPK